MEPKKNSGAFSYIATFALSFGCIIGWGYFIVPGIRYIPTSGAVGAIIGVILATVIAQVICVNYIGMARRFPEAAGSYDLIKGSFGADHAFFMAWALLLAYVCILWANASSIAYLGRFLFGGSTLYLVHYTFMGFDVYPGDIFFTAAILILGALILCRGYSFALKVIAILFFVLAISIVIMFFGVMSKSDIHQVLSPAFSSANTMSKEAQIFAIAVMAPWIFIGFETVSHVVSETRLHLTRVFTTSALAVGAAAVCIIMVILITNSTVPDGYRSWGDLSVLAVGIRSFDEIPAFYGVYRAMGDVGTVILAIAFFTALFGSVIGYFLAASHTIKIMADDGLTPRAFLKTNKEGVPYNAIHLILAFSVPFLFVGMNMLSWAIDISALAICIVYGYISLGNLLKTEAKMGFRVIGLIGAILSFFIFFILILPNPILGAALVKEDYLILLIWSLAGLICYRFVLFLDKEKKLGKSMLMWLLLFFLLFFSANVWTFMQMQDDMRTAANSDEMTAILITDNLLRSLVVIVALIVLFELFAIMLRREQELTREIREVKENSYIKNTILSDMSHDIRTPVNAIVGFADLALQDPTDNEKLVEHIKKIRLSGINLSTLINDMFAVNRIENNTMDLKEESINLPELILHIRRMASAGAYFWDHELVVEGHHLEDEIVISDRSNLMHILSYFTNNAIKNTPDGGRIVFGVMQLSHSDDNTGMYEFFIRDSGGGYLPGGVGYDITKKIIKVMGGHLEIEPVPGVGTEVYITIELPVSVETVKKEDEDLCIELSGKRALVVDDILVNRQIAIAMLEMYGMDTDEAYDGEEAYRMIYGSLPGHFDVVLMDIELPGINVYEVSKKIRALDDPINSSVPIFAMTANVFDDDKKKADEAGMNGFITKPVNREYMIGAIAEALSNRQGDRL